MFNSIDEFAAGWKNDAMFHDDLHKSFVQRTNADYAMKEHRDFVERHAFGMGERSFAYFHNIILKDLDEKTPKEQPTLRLLEVGVHRGQTISLWAMLAQRLSRPVEIVGVSLFDGGEIDPPEMVGKREYRDDVKLIVKEFTGEIPAPEFHWFWMGRKFSMQLVKGDSTNPDVVKSVASAGEYDLVYVDGGHTWDVARADVINYGSMVRSGGLLLIDDCANNNHRMHWGYFQGIQSVSDAVDGLLPPAVQDPSYEYLGNVVHQRLWRRK